jgi:hypothetical protein
MGKGFAITNQKVSISIGLNGRINVRPPLASRDRLPS